ncbi:MAG TPA: VWA domain-containing protein [Bryobacteraceae bacterium]|nr:VWA domain-containing protein [Bryobacteraceae bacterium]
MRTCSLLLFLVFAAAAQQRPPAQAAVPSAPNVKFSANSNLVIVDVTVKDKAGKPIEGLKQNDFTVLEDGKPQNVSVFEFQRLSLDVKPPEPPPSLADVNALPEKPRTVIETESPGQVQYHDKRLLVLYFDFSSMEIPEQLRAQQAGEKFIDTQISKADLVAILLYSSQLQVLTDFTDNRDQLKDIIQSLPIGDMSDVAGVADTGDDNGEDTGAAFVADETEFNIFNTNEKLEAIEDAVRKLSSLPEKKALIFFSSGISRSGLDNDAQLEATINAATKANVTIFPIDARGLMADPPGGGASKGSSRGSGIFSGSVQNAQRQAINDSQDTLNSLAADTGGKMFIDSNDLSLGIVAAQQEYRSYYILGYYSSNNAQDGRYRRITVKLNNKLEAKLEHRQGYYASKVWGKFNSAEKELQLDEAMNAADPITDLPIAVEIDYFRVTPTAYFVPVSVKVPGSVIELAKKRGASETEFDFIGQIQDERKQVVGNVSDFIKVKLDTEDAARLSRRNFLYDAGFTLEPGKYRMKFLVRENQTGKMGTFDARFVIPDLASDSIGLKTSSIVWSSQREPLKAAVGMAARMNRKATAANPLVIGNEKVVPSITKVFRRGQNLYIAFDVYDAAPDPADPHTRRVNVSMSLFNQKGVKAFEAGPLKATQLAVTRPNAVPVQLQVPLKSLAPGRYTCQLNVVDAVGRKFAFPRQPLIIVR